MGHRDDGPGDPGCGAGAEDLIEERDEDGEAFEREALGAEVALLDDLLEEVGTDELGEDMLLIGLGRGLLKLLLQPLALLGVGDVHELGGKGAAVVAAGFGGGVALGNGDDGKGFGRKILAKGIEGRLQVSPAAKDVEGCFAFKLIYGCCRWGKGPCLGGHCFLACVIRERVFRVHYYARPFGAPSHVAFATCTSCDYKVARHKLGIEGF